MKVNIFLFLILPLSLFSEIFKTSHFKDLLEVANPHHLIAVDINGVLIQESIENKSDELIETSMERSISDAIKHLQQHKIPLMGLTAQSFRKASKIEQELFLIDVDFSKGLIFKKKEGVDSPYLKKYMNGIFFCGLLEEKGSCLKKFLELIEFKPSCVVLIDDRLSNLRSVEKAMQELGIPFIGFWYVLHP